jgi:hypothetical protein
VAGGANISIKPPKIVGLAENRHFRIQITMWILILHFETNPNGPCEKTLLSPLKKYTGWLIGIPTLDENHPH